MDHEFVFYAAGATGIQDVAVCRDGQWFGGFGNAPEADLLARGFRRVLFDDALEEIQKRQRETFCRGVQACTRETFMEMLEVLPPARWEVVDGVELFAMSERTTGDLTAWYGQLDGVFVTITESTRAKTADLARQVREFVQRAPT